MSRAHEQSMLCTAMSETKKGFFGRQKPIAGWAPSAAWWQEEQVLPHTSIKHCYFLHAPALALRR